MKSKNLLEAVQKDRQEEILTRLVLGEKVDAVFTMGRTALHCAAANSNIDAVSTLLMYSPDLKVCRKVPLLRKVLKKTLMVNSITDL